MELSKLTDSKAKQAAFVPPTDRAVREYLSGSRKEVNAQPQTVAAECGGRLRIADESSLVGTSKTYGWAAQGQTDRKLVKEPAIFYWRTQRYAIMAITVNTPVIR